MTPSAEPDIGLYAYDYDPVKRQRVRRHHSTSHFNYLFCNLLAQRGVAPATHPNNRNWTGVVPCQPTQPHCQSARKTNGPHSKIRPSQSLNIAAMRFAARQPPKFDEYSGARQRFQSRNRPTESRLEVPRKQPIRGWRVIPANPNNQSSVNSRGNPVRDPNRMLTDARHSFQLASQSDNVNDIARFAKMAATSCTSPIARRN